MNPALNEFDWIRAAMTWFVVLLSAAAIGYAFASLIAGRARGSLVDGFAAAAQAALDLFRDLVALSPRRIFALAWHSVLESIRRRMLLAVFGVLVVIFMFGGWFLQGRPIDQVKIYVSFVLLCSTLLSIPAAGLLACLSLPSDIRDKTIHTVITKPVRRLEIVLGRILGLTIVTTVFLAIVGTVSYVYMSRSVGGTLAELRQQLSSAKGDVRREAELKDSIDQINSKMDARVPVYSSKFHFEGPDKQAKPGTNVGNENVHRLFIPGNSADAAVWTFESVPTDRLKQRNGIPLEMNFSVFRTTKGDMGHGVLAEITYSNPVSQRQIIDYPFEVREYYVNQQTLENTSEGHRYYEKGQPLAVAPANPLEWLFQAGGGLRIEVRCLSGSQYIGMAREDLYILLDHSNFGLNFAKGMIGVWLRVFLIICVAVMFSTVLSSYVAMLATAAVFFGGWRIPYLKELATGRAEGGGPIEAAHRLFMHENLQRPLEESIWTDMIKSFDVGFQGVFKAITHLLPDLGLFNSGAMVADGFNISGSQLLANFVLALAYAIPVTVASYYLLRSREIAR